MKIISPAFAPNDAIPSIYTCDSSNFSPPLNFVDIPNNTQSLALVMYDPDSPGGNFIHWLLWNINPQTTSILENLSPPESSFGINDFGNLNYGGPCPSHGIHHYHFVLYALDQKLDLANGSSYEDFQAAIKNHILNQTETVGLYSR